MSSAYCKQFTKSLSFVSFLTVSVAVTPQQSAARRLKGEWSAVLSEAEHSFEK